MRYKKTIVELLRKDREFSKFLDKMNKAGLDAGTLDFGTLDEVLDLLGVPEYTETYCRDWLTDKWFDNPKMSPQKYINWVWKEIFRNQIQLHNEEEEI